MTHSAGKGFTRNFTTKMTLALLALSFGALAHAQTVQKDDDYDRLDGTGLSGKKVNVIEWEGNLEIHVYPAGSLKGLSLKLDKKNDYKPVMVIGYRFEGSSTPLIRRAILGIKLNEGFKTYRDTTADGYDKIVISNNGLATPLVAFKLDTAPAQSYPDGHPMNNATDVAKISTDTSRKPAASEEDEDSKQPMVEEEGRILPFYSREHR
jgi:hypothetical protein